MKTKFISRLQLGLSKSEILELMKMMPQKNSKIKEFERQFARYVGVKHAIAMPSGKLALYVILNSLDTKKMDEVILPAYTSVSVPNMVIASGLIPTFIDIDPETYNINPKLIQKNISSRAKIILATHIYGQPCDLDIIMKIAKKYKLYVIEDCAHACGAEYGGKRVGSFGDAGFFSFGLGKHLATAGGGMIVTNDSTIAKKARKINEKLKIESKFDLSKKLLSYFLISFFTRPYVFSFTIFPLIYFFGNEWLTKIFEEKKVLLKEIPKKYLTRFSNVQAAIGLYKLKEIDDNNERRIENAKLLTETLKSMKSIRLQKSLPDTKHVYLNYVVTVNERERIINKMVKGGIDVQRAWMNDCSSLDIFKKFQKNCPISKNLNKTAIYLPIYPNLSKDDILHISEVLKNCVK